MPTLIEQNDFPLTTQLIHKGVALADFVEAARIAKCAIYYAPNPATGTLCYRAFNPNGSLYGTWVSTLFSTLWVRKEGV